MEISFSMARIRSIEDSITFTSSYISILLRRSDESSSSSLCYRAKFYKLYDGTSNWSCGENFVTRVLVTLSSLLLLTSPRSYSLTWSQALCYLSFPNRSFLSYEISSLIAFSRYTLVLIFGGLPAVCLFNSCKCSGSRFLIYLLVRCLLYRLAS